MKPCLYIIFLLLFSLVACTDYVGQIDGRIDERNAHEQARDESKIPVSEVFVDSASVFFGSFEDARDGRRYKTVTIGMLTWMAENLNYETEGGYCYDADIENCAKYGRLYTWAAAMDSAGVWSENGKGCGYGKFCAPTYPVKGVCPDEWHLPSYGEWMTLFSSVDTDPDASLFMLSGSVLKSRSGWNQGNNEDTYGFSVLPAGAWMEVDERGALFYSGMESAAYFWMATEETRDDAYSFYIDSNSPHRDIASKEYGYSVRCVKNVTDKKAEKDSSGQTPESSSSGRGDDTETSSSSVESSESDESSSSAIEYGTLVDSRDGRAYKTVTIGTQVWMAENLDYDARHSICRDDPDDCEKYGHYYTWAIAMDSVGEFSENGLGCGYDTICEPTYPVRGICPEGWHLPRGSEYWTLIETVGGESAAAEKLKSTSGWDYFENGVDTYGFNILPAGGCGYDGCGDVGGSATFWTSDGQKESEVSGIVGLEADYGLAYTTDESRYHAFSVRCVKD